MTHENLSGEKRTFHCIVDHQRGGTAEIVHNDFPDLHNQLQDLFGEHDADILGDGLIQDSRSSQMRVCPPLLSTLTCAGRSVSFAASLVACFQHRSTI